MFRHHNTNSIAINMDITILNFGCKYGLRNNLTTFFSIVQNICDSTTANTKMNFFPLKYMTIPQFVEDCWLYEHNSVT